MVEARDDQTQGTDPLGLGGTTAPDAPSRRPRPKIVALLGEFFRMSRASAVLLVAFVLTAGLYFMVKEEPVVAFSPSTPVPTTPGPPEPTGSSPVPSTPPTGTTGVTPTTGATPTGTETDVPTSGDAEQDDPRSREAGTGVPQQVPQEQQSGDPAQQQPGQPGGPQAQQESGAGADAAPTAPAQQSP